MLNNITHLKIKILLMKNFLPTLSLKVEIFVLNLLFLHHETFVSGIDQTRGWFYTLLVLSTALFDKPPFKNLICNGLVLASG